MDETVITELLSDKNNYRLDLELSVLKVQDLIDKQLQATNDEPSLH